VFLLRRDGATAHAQAAAAPKAGKSVWAVGGNNLYGTLGLGDHVSRDKPTLISALAHAGPIVQLVAAGNHAAALGEDGRLWTWGSAVAGVLGHEVDAAPKAAGASAASGAAVLGTCTLPQPVEALAGRRIVRVALSETHAAAVEQLPDGSTQVWSWGTRALGLGDSEAHQEVDLAALAKSRGRGSLDIRSGDAPENGNPSVALLPQLVTSLQGERIVDVACGPAHTLALTADGRVYSFGVDRDGALGMGDRAPRFTPTPVLDLDAHGPIVAIAAGNGSSLFLAANGTVLSCGANDRGQGGTGSTQRRHLAPVPVASLRDIAAISAGTYHAAAVAKDGTMYAWGLNQSGQCGVGNRNLELRQPQPVTGALASARVVQLDAGFAHTGAISSDARLWVFGRGREGQLGRGDQLESVANWRDTPVEVPFFSQRHLHVLQVAVGADFTLALVEEDAKTAEKAMVAGQRR